MDTLADTLVDTLADTLVDTSVDGQSGQRLYFFEYSLFFCGWMCKKIHGFARKKRKGFCMQKFYYKRAGKFWKEKGGAR